MTDLGYFAASVGQRVVQVQIDRKWCKCGYWLGVHLTHDLRPTTCLAQGCKCKRFRRTWWAHWLPRRSNLLSRRRFDGI